jgi:hypothetical protein
MRELREDTTRSRSNTLRATAPQVSGSDRQPPFSRSLDAKVIRSLANCLKKAFDERWKSVQGRHDILSSVLISDNLERSIPCWGQLSDNVFSPNDVPVHEHYVPIAVSNGNRTPLISIAGSYISGGSGSVWARIANRFWLQPGGRQSFPIVRCVQSFV